MSLGPIKWLSWQAVGRKRQFGRQYMDPGAYDDCGSISDYMRNRKR